MVQIKAFSLSGDEQALVRGIRRTSDKRELLPMVKELGTRMERRLSPILLKQFGFEKIEQLGKRVNTGPEPFDFSAERDGRIYFINSKAMAKRERFQHKRVEPRSCRIPRGGQRQRRLRVSADEGL